MPEPKAAETKKTEQPERTKEERISHAEQKQMLSETAESLPLLHKKRPKRAYLKIEEKPLRRFPKRAEIIVRTPTKKGIGIRTITMPEPQVEFKELKYEKNPNLITIQFGQVKITWRKDLGKGAVYDKEGNFAGAYEKHDLKNQWNKEIALLHDIKNRKRTILYSRYNNQCQNMKEK